MGRGKQAKRPINRPRINTRRAKKIQKKGLDKGPNANGQGQAKNPKNLLQPLLVILPNITAILQTLMLVLFQVKPWGFSPLPLYLLSRNLTVFCWFNMDPVAEMCARWLFGDLNVTSFPLNCSL